MEGAERRDGATRTDGTGRTGRTGRDARALAAFEGLALGDALGMPTQSLSRAQIAADHGRITGLVDAGPHQRIAAGLPAGSITDDTEQAVLLARLLIDGGGTVEPLRYAERLLAWEEGMRRRGSLDLLGPSTRAALQRLQECVPPAEAGRFGATNGAAMRVTPVGILAPAESVAALVDTVAATAELTHDTGIGIAAAAAVAAAVSAGIDGAGRSEALNTAIVAAEEGARRGHWVAGGSIAARLRWAIPYLRPLPSDAQDDALTEVIGTSVAAQESVVAALALVAVADDPWRALCRAVSLGGDTDTIAAIAGAVLGATGARWPEGALATVREVNDLDLGPIVQGLLALRDNALRDNALRDKRSARDRSDHRG